MALGIVVRQAAWRCGALTIRKPITDDGPESGLWTVVMTEGDRRERRQDRELSTAIEEVLMAWLHPVAAVPATKETV
jgi:hypothetical protein